MNKANLINTINTLGALANKHLPAILCAAGSICSIFAVIEAVDAAEDLDEALEEAEKAKGESLTIIEELKVVFKTFWKSITAEGTALLCFWAAFGVSRNRLLALTAAYSMEKQAFSDYILAAKSVVGENKEDKITTKMAQTYLDEHPVQDSLVHNTGKGDYLCYDPWIGRYFTSNENYVRTVFNDASRYLRANDCITMNEIYSRLLLDEVSIGEHIGFDTTYMREPYIDVEFKTGRATDGRPCLVLVYNPMPIGSWRKYDSYDNQWNYGY